MVTQTNITSKFKGETVGILFAAKEPDGSVIESPASQTIIVTIARSNGGQPVLSFFEPPQVVLSGVAAGEWTIEMTADDLSIVKENETYYYNIWSQATGGPLRLQARGQLKLRSSIEPL